MRPTITYRVSFTITSSARQFCSRPVFTQVIVPSTRVAPLVCGKAGLVVPVEHAPEQDWIWKMKSPLFPPITGFGNTMYPVENVVVPSVLAFFTQSGAPTLHDAVPLMFPNCPMPSVEHTANFPVCDRTHIPFCTSKT